MKLFLSLLLCYSANIWASNTPDNINNGNQKAIFVDFQKANYNVHYDITNKKVIAKTVIVFEQNEEGTPIFDLVEDVLDIRIDGKKTQSKEIRSPDRETLYKTITTSLSSGVHTLEIKNEIQENVRFKKGGVQSAFWMSDLSDRNYLEQYLPTNIEYDHYAMTLNIEFSGNQKDQRIYTNGKLYKLSKNRFQIDFPAYFTTSSLFFHTATEGRFKQTSAQYKSLNGKNIPITVYSSSSWNLNSAREKALKVLKELETKFGAWSHPSLTIYIAGQGGMEYCGATITSLSALGHEMTHSYFARGVMPVDGNSGWMDEAIASWRDNGYPTAKQPNFNSTAMANHSQYRRTTDRKAYTQGANFMAYLDYNLSNLGGLEKFLSKLYLSYTHTSIKTENFRKELEYFSGLNFEADFKQYIYGQESVQKEKLAENPYHPKLTKQQLIDLL